MGTNFHFCFTEVPSLFSLNLAGRGCSCANAKHCTGKHCTCKTPPSPGVVEQSRNHFEILATQVHVRTSPTNKKRELQSQHDSQLPERDLCFSFGARILVQALETMFLVLHPEDSEAIFASHFFLLVAFIAYFYFCMRRVSFSRQANQARLFEVGPVLERRRGGIPSRQVVRTAPHIIPCTKNAL